MVDVMLTAMPFHGHAVPMAAVAEAFVRDGHAVRVYTGRAHAARFEDVGAEAVLWDAARDFDELDLSATYPELVGTRGWRRTLENIEHLFVRTGADQAADLLAAYAERRWDVIVADGLSLGARFASEHTATPWVSVSVVPLAMPSRTLPPPGSGLAPARGPAGRARDALLRSFGRVALRGLQRAYVDERRRSGLPTNDLTLESAFFSPDLICASGVEEIEYPRPDATAPVVFVGELTRPAAAGAAESGDAQSLPDWWDELATTTLPVVHVTQGTLNVDPVDLIEPTFAALGRQRVLLVATTGRADDASLPFPAPPNARVAGRVPYRSLLPRTDVMITNGGWGGVLAALAQGIPLIVAGGDVDKPEVAARVAWAGAGVNLRTGRPRARAVLAAWRRVSTDAAYRTAARRIAARLAEHDGPAEVVEHTLALVRRRRG